MKRAETKGTEATLIRLENERLKELAKLTDPQRKALRKAVLFGLDDYAASAAADCAVHYAIAMRARLNSIGLLPPPPTKRQPRKAKVDPRQTNLLDEIGA